MQLRRESDIPPFTHINPSPRAVKHSPRNPGRPNRRVAGISHSKFSPLSEAGADRNATGTKRGGRGHFPLTLMAFSMSLSSDMLRGHPTVGRVGGCAATRSHRSRGSKGLGDRAPGPRGDGQQPPPGTGGVEGAGSASAGGSRLATAAAAAPGDKHVCWAPRGRLPASSPAGEAGSWGRAKQGGPRFGALCRGLAGPPLRPWPSRS